MDSSQLRLILWVAVGGAIGSVARYLVSGALDRAVFPWGTFVVNLTGTFLITFLFFLTVGRGGLSPEGRTFLFVGVFGGFTTFSTFGLETVTLFRSGSTLLALANVALNAGVCLAGAFAGALLGLLAGGR
jgi:CrcB protein